MHLHIYRTKNRITKFYHTVILIQLFHQLGDLHQWKYSFHTLKRSVVPDKH